MFNAISAVLSWVNTHSKSSGTIESVARVPKFGDIRVEPRGLNEFTIDRYTHDRWVFEYRGSKDECDQWVAKYLKELREERERARRYSEAVTKHRLANPTKYYRLEN